MREKATSPWAFVSKSVERRVEFASRLVSVVAAGVAKAFERRVASSPSPQHLPFEGPVRLSHLVLKALLDGGDAALARSGSAGVFDMTVD
jgi:hypothetical protein